MNRINVVPVIKWAGGKRQIMNEIDKRINLLEKPEEMTYIEPFLGGGSVFLHVISRSMFKEYIISDINEKLINLYIQIRDNPNEFIKELNKYKSEYLSLNDEERKEYYYKIRKEFNESLKEDRYKLSDNLKLKNATMFMFLNKTCFNGLYRENKNGFFNVPSGSYKNPSIFDPEDIFNLSYVLNLKKKNGENKVKILNKDYKYFLDESIKKENIFIYCDPPYRPITEGGFNSYHKSSFNDDEQIKLANFYKEMDSKGAKILLSNSDPKNLNSEDNFFDELYKEFNIERISANRTINSNKNDRGYVTELLISNYK